MEQEIVTVATDRALDDVIIYQDTIAYVSVCAIKSLTIEEVTKQVNDIMNRSKKSIIEYKLSKDKFLSSTGIEMSNPCLCNTDPLDRIHYLFEC